MLNESVLNAMDPLYLLQFIKTNHEAKFFETAIETLNETKSFQSVTCISLEKEFQE